MKNKNNLDLSNIVSSFVNGKKHSFDSEFIIPLKQELFRKAVENDEHIIPCGVDHFAIHDGELFFWYNSLKDKSTKVIKLKMGN